MDVPKNIPKLFWYSLSIAILVVSIGLTYIAYKSSNVTIELANTKINLTSEIASTALKAALEDAKKAKFEAEEKYKELLNKYEFIKKQMASIKSQIESDNINESDINEISKIYSEFIDTPKLPEKLEFKSFDANITRAQKSLEKLDTINRPFN